jgi:leucyl aminopeptidase
LIRFHCSEKRVGEAAADAVALLVWKDAPLKGTSALHRALAKHSRADGFQGKAGETFLYHAPEGSASPRYLLVGMGPENRAGLESLRVAAAALARQAARLKCRRLAVAAPHGGPLRGSPPDALAQALAEGVLLGAYRFDRYRTEDPDSGSGPGRVDILLGRLPRPKVLQGIRRGEIFSGAANLARTLVTEAPSELTPLRMASIARQKARRAGIQCKVLRRAELTKRGMGGILGVARGSAEEPCLIHLRYRPRRRPLANVALVGKGITFDSGGLSLKSPSPMETMKSDMAGSAAVLAVLQALPDLKVPVAVDGIMAMSENMPSGSAQKPGDILKTLSGKTVEVLNTDAEGRLVLADALTYAGKLGPDQIIDVATLTGACVVALGHAAAGVMSNDPPLVKALLAAADRSGEKMWQLPLYDEYLEMMRSPVADLKNAGPRWGSALTAALFLREFVPKDVPWAHLDIAGPAFLDRADGAFPEGATGASVRTLLHHLEGIS